jgi:hypothetical protein
VQQIIEVYTSVVLCYKNKITNLVISTFIYNHNYTVLNSFHWPFLGFLVDRVPRKSVLPFSN